METMDDGFVINICARTSHVHPDELVISGQLGEFGVLAARNQK